jgi:hypothetical protein
MIYKKIVLALILIFLFHSCGTPYYAGVNDMGGQPATLLLTTGVELNGKIQIKSFDQYSNISYVNFAEGTSNNYHNYPLNEIDYLYFNGSKFYVKLLQGNDMWGGNALRFVKQLTPNNSDLQLYENEFLVKSTDGKVTKEMQLFVQLPQNKLEIYNAQSDKFIPKFDEKVSNYLQNCPELSSKIKSKDKDFFYAFVNQGETKRKQVWMNIVNEYNQCR